MTAPTPLPDLTLALESAPVADLARLLGVTPKTIYRWLEGETVPAVKRRWLSRWNRSTIEARKALITWSTL